MLNTVRGALGFGEQGRRRELDGANGKQPSATLASKTTPIFGVVLTVAMTLAITLGLAFPVQGNTTANTTANTIAAAPTKQGGTPPSGVMTPASPSSGGSNIGGSNIGVGSAAGVGQVPFQSVATQYYSANKLLSEGDSAAAIPILENLLKTESSPTLYNKIILAYQAQGDLPNATSRLEVALDLYPDNDTLRESGVLLYYQAQNYDRALGLAKELEASESFDTSQGLLYEAIIYADTKEYKKGLKAIKRIEKDRGEQVATELLKGTMLTGIGKEDEGLQVFDRVFNATGGADFVLAHITGTYYYFEMFPPIAYFLERKATVSTGQARDLYLIEGAVLFFTLGNYENSTRLLKMVNTTIASVESSVNFNIGLNQILLNNTAEGVGYLEESINTNMEDGKTPHSSEPYAYTILAKAYIIEGGGQGVDEDTANAAYNKALAVLERGMKDYPNYGENYLTATIIYADDRGGKGGANLADARKSINRYGELESTSSSYYYWSSFLYLLEGRAEESHAEADAGLNLFPGNPSLMGINVDACISLENYDCAVANAEQLLQYGGETPDRLNTLGYLYAVTGENLDEGEKLVKKALKANPKSFYYLDSLAWVYYKKGDLKRAKKYIVKAEEALDGYEQSVANGNVAKDADADVLRDAREEINQHKAAIDVALTASN